MLDCMYVMISEMLIDWTKHAFITRFNEINLSVYSDYVLSFAYDTAQSRHKKVYICNYQYQVFYLFLFLKTIF